MSYKLAIFDFDGTVLDTLEDLTDSVNYALSLNSLPTRTISEICAFIGSGSRLLIERSVPTGCDSAVTDRVFEQYQAYYKTHGDIKTKAYDGIIDMLSALKSRGIKLAVLSNKPDFAVQILCKQYFGDIFDFMSGERVGIPRKPSPDGVNAVLEHFGADRSDAVYIGDSEVDVETARNVGIDCISVTWGFRTEKQLLEAGAACTVSDADSLFEAITK